MDGCGVELRRSGNGWFGEMFKGAGLASRTLSGNGLQLYLEALCGGIGHAPLQLPARKLLNLEAGMPARHTTLSGSRPTKPAWFNTAPDVKRERRRGNHQTGQLCGTRRCSVTDTSSSSCPSTERIRSPFSGWSIVAQRSGVSWRQSYSAHYSLTMQLARRCTAPDKHSLDVGLSTLSNGK